MFALSPTKWRNLEPASTKPPRRAAARPLTASGCDEGLLRTDAKLPEWRTDAWKRHVEAEARCKLKDRIHDIGARR